MRVLTANGIFTENVDGQYEHNAMSRAYDEKQEVNWSDFTVAM